jgi:hypothetical protein
MNHHMKKIFVSTGITVSILILPFVTLAAVTTTNNPASSGTTQCPADAVCNPLQATSITTLLNDAVDVLIPVGAVIAVLAFIFVGFKFIFAQGKPEEITKAWKAFLWIAVGTAILIGAKVIIAVITGTLDSTGLVQKGLLGN